MRTFNPSEIFVPLKPWKNLSWLFILVLPQVKLKNISLVLYRLVFSAPWAEAFSCPGPGVSHPSPVQIPHMTLLSLLSPTPGQERCLCLKCGSTQREIPCSGTTSQTAVCNTAVGPRFAGRNVMLAQMPRNICADSETHRHMVGWEVRW